MDNQELLFAAKHISEYVRYDICNDTITNGLVKSFVSYTIQKTNISAIDYYLSWLEKEIDDGTAMKYAQKPSPELSDDTVIAVFYTNVWNIFQLREYQEKLIQKMFFEKSHRKSNPLVITMAYYKQFSNWEQSVGGINDFFKQLKKRSYDNSLVEIIKTANVSFSDVTIIVKIYGDIWKNGPLFKQYPDE